MVVGTRWAGFSTVETETASWGISHTSVYTEQCKKTENTE